MTSQTNTHVMRGKNQFSINIITAYFHVYSVSQKGKFQKSENVTLLVPALIPNAAVLEIETQVNMHNIFFF